MDLYLTSVLAFFAVLGVIIYKDRKNVEVKYILLMRKTKKGIVFLDKIAKYKKFWGIVGILGVIIAFYLMFTGVFTLTEYGRKLITREVKAPGLSFIFPSPTSEAIAGPGFIGLPFWDWIIIIASVMIPHELLHGILSRVEKIKVKSMGLLLFAIFPGAFVEPDEKQLKKSKLLTKLKIYAAGSFANFLVASLLFLPSVNLGALNLNLNVGLLPNVLWPAYVPGPIVLTDVNSSSPAYEGGLRAGMVLAKVNNMPINASYTEFAATGGNNYLLEEAGNLKPGDNITVVANDTTYKITVGKQVGDSTRPYLGITYRPIVNGDDSFVFGFMFQLFYLLTWMWMLSLAIAIVNISPIYPLDGGLIVEALAEKVSRKHYKAITYAITFVMFIVFFINFATPYIYQLLT
jgi:membrane-associated protease RseP (regulator of RpoE activity)